MQDTSVYALDHSIWIFYFFHVAFCCLVRIKYLKLFNIYDIFCVNILFLPSKIINATFFKVPHDCRILC